MQIIRALLILCGGLAACGDAAGPAGDDDDQGGVDGGADAGHLAIDAGPDVDADLPGSIEGVEPEAHGHFQVMCDSHNVLYRVTESPISDANEQKMMRSIDGGGTWEEMDKDHRPEAHDLEGGWQLQVGTSIFTSQSVGYRTWFSEFHTSDAADRPDQWVVAEQPQDDGTADGVKQFSSLTRTSDGRFWIFHTDAPASGRQQIVYIQRLGPDDYSSPQALDAESGSWTAPVSVLGQDDVTHVFYQDVLARQLRWRTLAADGTLSASRRVDTSGTASVSVPETNPVSYDAGGSEVVVIAFGDPDGTLRTVSITDGQVGAEEIVSPSPILLDPGITDNDASVAHLAVEGTTVYAIWADVAGDIWLATHPHGGSWSEPTRVWDSGADEAEWVYLNFYERNGRRRLGFTYDIGPHPDDTGNIEFRELTLGLAP